MLAHAVNHVAETSRLAQVRVALILSSTWCSQKIFALSWCPIISPSALHQNEYSYSTITIQKIHIFGGNFNIFGGDIRVTVTTWVFGSFEDLIAYLQSKQLLARNKPCPTCNAPMDFAT